MFGWSVVRRVAILSKLEEEKVVAPSEEVKLPAVSKDEKGVEYDPCSKCRCIGADRCDYKPQERAQVPKGFDLTIISNELIREGKPIMLMHPNDYDAYAKSLKVLE